MPTNYKILGQACPADTNSTNLYTVPSATQAVVSSIVVCNLSATAATFRLSTAIAGATLANSQYIAFDVTVGANDSTIITIGATLNATDVIRVRSSSANNITFTAYGSEIS